MSKGYAVYPLMRQPGENVIDERLIRECIFLAPVSSTDDERMRLVGNREEALLQEKTQRELESIDLHKVTTLTLSHQQIRRIENLYGLGSLSKLCLDNNRIEQISGLSHLVSLEHLDLSFNRITVIEGLDELVNLDTLILSSNRIKSVDGLPELPKLVTLSLEKNLMDSLDETAKALHRIRSLRVLTLKGCKIESLPTYRQRILAFVGTLRFLDGRAIKKEELAKAREEQREILLPIDDEDERREAATRAQRELEAVEKEYQRYNCPNETKLCDALFDVAVEGYRMMDILKGDSFVSAFKETVDKFQTEFNEKAKELAEAMKAICERREKDDKAYRLALQTYNERNTSASKQLIKAFESHLKAYVPKGIAAKPKSDITTRENELKLRSLLEELQSDLVEKEADQFDVFDSLHTATITKWKSDAVDVLLQSSFENLLKLDGDFQTSLRQIFDSIYEQRQKRDPSKEDIYLGSKKDETAAAVFDTKEEYQKVLNDWFEARRRRLEEMEIKHLKAEETLLRERTHAIVATEQDRHRERLHQISEYVERMMEAIDDIF